jgi:hypothetical protein
LSLPVAFLGARLVLDCDFGAATFGNFKNRAHQILKVLASLRSFVVFVFHVSILITAGLIMPNRKARRAVLQAKVQKNKMETADDCPDPAANHTNKSPQKHNTSGGLTEGPPARTNSVETEGQPPNPANKPNPFEATMKLWAFIKKPEHANATMAIFTILIFLATGGYAVVALLQWNSMRESNQISRESLESVQRAIVAYQNVELTRGKNGDNAYWVIQPFYENDGNTTALHVVSAWTFAEGKGTITEKMFKSGKTGSMPDKLTEWVIAPRAVLGSVAFPVDESYIFGMNLGDKLENFPMAHQRDDSLIFGWVVYRDVFPRTKTHLTEFCKHFTPSDRINKEPPSIKFNLENCPEHNCTDEYCSDYTEIVSYAESKLVH